MLVLGMENDIFKDHKEITTLSVGLAVLFIFLFLHMQFYN